MQVLARSLILAVVLVLVQACASSDVGKALQSSEGAKLAVESAGDEVIRMHLTCTDGRIVEKVPANDPVPCTRRLSDLDYAKAADAYNKWAKAETAYTEAFVAWTRSKTAENDSKVQAALSNLGPLLTAALDTVCSFKAQSSALATICGNAGK